MGLLGVTGQLLPNSERRLVMNAENPAESSPLGGLDHLAKLLKGPTVTDNCFQRDTTYSNTLSL